MEFRLLGPVEVRDGAGALALGGTKVRTLLAALLLAPGRIVSTERLIEAIWDEDPPATAPAILQTYVSRLRRAIGVDGSQVIRTHPTGYLANINGGVLDRQLFDTHAADGRAAAAAGRFAVALEEYRAAEALWRGPALDGARTPSLLPEAVRLDEQRIAVVEGRVDTELALGRGSELVGELSMLVEQFPTRESLRGQLMIALHRGGRTADALTVYRQARQALIDELGIEPGAELSSLHEAILRSDPALLSSQPSESAGARTSVAPPATPQPPSGPPARRGDAERPDEDTNPPMYRPAQLPPDPTDFTGRDVAVQQLVELFDGSHRATAIAVVAGPGGVGKSALTIHVAHQLRAVYPDGQLHVDLRGTGPVPASPAEVLGRFLRALQVDPNAIPTSADERMDAYRSRLSGRRMLVVLDDAANEQQVRPLLPGDSGCGVLISARNRLPGLAGAQLLELDMLTVDEATTLLSRVAGADRIQSSPDAATRIVRSCGRLPLAVRIAGARLAARRQWSPGLLADRLADERRRLDELRVGDQQIRATIEMSYRALDAATQTALRRLGRLGLPDFPDWVVAALLDSDPATAESVIEHLVDAHLVDYTFVDQTGGMRYRLHDLIRIFAREQAERDEPEPDLLAAITRVFAGWRAVLGRLVEHIVDRATSGAIHVSPLSAVRSVDSALVAVALADPRGWLDAEQTSLVLAVELAAELRLDEIAVELATVLCASGYPLNHVEDLWNRVHDAGLQAARRSGDEHGEAVLVAALGQRRYEQDQFAEARRYLSEAVSLFRDLGDQRGEAASLVALGLACRDQGYLPEAQHFLRQAATPVRALDDDQALAHWQRILGSVHLEQGHFADADAALEEALAAYRRVDNRRGAALTLRTIGLAHRARGRLSESEHALTHALAVFRDLGDLTLEAFCLRALAKTQLRMGRAEQAQASLDAALRVHRARHDRWSEAMALRTLGELELAAGRLAHADRWLAEALAIFQEQDATLFAARTLRDIATLRQAQGEHAQARLARAEAVDVFRRYGAREYGELTT
jgi:DNA-binding SARP family transcriptional activator/tetratricopeptide (TPR) repeat protein